MAIRPCSVSRTEQSVDFVSDCDEAVAVKFGERDNEYPLKANGRPRRRYVAQCRDPRLRPPRSRAAALSPAHLSRDSATANGRAAVGKPTGHTDAG